MVKEFKIVLNAPAQGVFFSGSACMRCLGYWWSK